MIEDFGFSHRGSMRLLFFASGNDRKTIIRATVEASQGRKRNNPEKADAFLAVEDAISVVTRLANPRDTDPAVVSGEVVVLVSLAY